MKVREDKHIESQGEVLPGTAREGRRVSKGMEGGRGSGHHRLLHA